MIPAGEGSSCGSGELSAVFSLRTYLSSGFFHKLVLAPLSFGSPFLALACTGDAAPSPSGRPSPSLPHALVIKPGRGRRGSPWSSSVAAAPTENSKERRLLSGWERKRPFALPGHLLTPASEAHPQEQALSCPPRGISVRTAGWCTEGLGQIHP